MKEKQPTATVEQRTKRAAKAMEWAKRNPEKTKEYARQYYLKHADRRRAYSRAYNQAHREERAAYSHEYYLRRRREDPAYFVQMNERTKARQKQRRVEARKNRPPSPRKKSSPSIRTYEQLVLHCKRTLNQYAYTAMEHAREACGDRVDEYLQRYPFEAIAEQPIRYHLMRYGISRASGAYDDCYDAGMLAYLYTIHRCAQMNCDYVLPYLLKMLTIYIPDALILYRDSHNLCHINGFREIRIDTEGAQRYV